MRDLCLESNVRGFEGPVSLGALFFLKHLHGLVVYEPQKEKFQDHRGMSRERSTYCSGYRCKRELTESSDRVQICVCSNTGKTMMADFKNTE